MAVYTDITDEELTTLLAGFDLGAPLAFKGIAEGVENSNFLLETEAGRYILTVYEKRVREDELPFFLDLMRWLADHDYPSAAPVPDRQGRMLQRVRGKPAVIVEFLTGLSVRRPTAAHCREAGEGLARLHLAAQGFPGKRANDLGQAAWAPLFARLGKEAEALKPGLAAVIQGDLDHLAAHWPKGLPEGIIHADFFPDNVFFQGPKFAAAFDFYFACVDALAYDIAVALNAWCFEPDGSFNITSARAMLTGYERHRPLSAAERAALPILAHGAAMRFFLTRLNDWGATPAGALVRPKDPLEYERKLAVHREAPDLVLFGAGA
ncbi:homoserine kinase [Phenylobacterium aquaticum]|uniref:homoserine kinase n=1 Tax=Phenylobacterium aquaticum TaxID=1763816 RepID=UPI001F5DE220|nr:homoserine kinase [Phenylobacterium aquaticum]MCI3134676.1 homoserine kinase [Phenylobacterium aquaticum]